MGEAFFPVPASVVDQLGRLIAHLFDLERKGGRNLIIPRVLRQRTADLSLCKYQFCFLMKRRTQSKGIFDILQLGMVSVRRAVSASRYTWNQMKFILSRNGALLLLEATL